MLQMYGYDGGTPTRRAHRALIDADPELAGIGGNVLDLTVLPRWTERGAAPRLPRARADAWYDLAWTTPEDRALLDGRARAGSSPAELHRLLDVLAAAGLLPPGGTAPEKEEAAEDALRCRALMAGVLLRRTLGRPGTLPMPDVIPVRSRLDALPPVTLDDVPDSHITLLGGRDKALRLLRQRQAAAVRCDRTVDIYDWPAWGHATAQKLRTLPAPVVD